MLVFFMINHSCIVIFLQNKEKFCYASLLIELEYVDVVEIAFLVVGHTSFALPTATKDFDLAIIFTLRLSLCHLLTIDSKSGFVELKVVHDYKSLLAPLVNKTIKYCQVPHRFIFSRLCNRAVIISFLLQIH